MWKCISHYSATCLDLWFIWNDFILGVNGQIDDIILVQPQGVKIKLRPGSSQKINFRIGQSPEYPLDLYFLLDLSWSMENTTKTVADKGISIDTNIWQKPW